MGQWIEQWQGQRNIYFAVNPPRVRIDKKLSKTDIAAMACLHVDVDPRPGQEHETERLRILSILRVHEPEPSVIVDSGGGYQAYWLLDHEHELDGTESTAERAEGYNRQLEIHLGGDHCHNVDRIMRVPGTVNLPDAKKRAKGRKPALAKIMEADFGKRYPLSLFTRAAAVQEDTGPGLRPEGVKISGNLPRVQLSELPSTVHDFTKTLIFHGRDPENPSKYSSRSEVVFRVACDLVRADVSDDVIASILLDPDYKISESVREQKRRDAYVARQIKRARDEVESPLLRELNDLHAVISNDGGKCVVVTEEADDALGGRPFLARQSFAAMRDRYLHRTVKVETRDRKGNPTSTYERLGNWWLSHPRRRQYDSITFAPGRETPGKYNLWRGFGCDAVPGDCTLLLEHTYKTVCSSNDHYYDYLMNWMARAVQKPDCPGEVAIVLRGRMGTGKGSFVKAFGSLWGRHYVHVSNSQHVVGNFNAHLRDCCVLFADEAFYAGDKKHEAVLRQLVTEDTIVLESKGVDARVAPNFLKIIMASNKDWVVPAGPDERRFFVLDVNDAAMQDTRYFAAVRKQLDEGGREAFLHTLLSRDISKFDVRKFPATEALQEQKTMSYSPIEDWWFEKLWEGRIMPNHQLWMTRIPRDALQEDYFRGMEMRKDYNPSSNRLGRFLKQACPVGWPKPGLIKYNGDRSQDKRSYEFPTLGKCRQHWDTMFGGPFDWPRVYEEAGLRSAPPIDPYDPNNQLSAF